MEDITKILREAKYRKTLEDPTYTLRKLSEILGIKFSVLQSIFYQGYVPSSKILLRLAKELGAPPVRILLAARKLTPEMEAKLFTWNNMVDLYKDAYGIQSNEYPSDNTNLGEG